MKASSNGHTAIAKILLENGAEIDAVDKQDKTALHQACDWGRAETV